MKKVIVVILILLFTSCSFQGNNSINANEEVPSQNKDVSIIYGHGFSDISNKDLFKIKDKGIEADYSINNVNDFEISVGLFIFTDGIPAKYSEMATDKSPAEFNYFLLPKNNDSEFKLFITPSVIENQEYTSISTLAVLSPEFVAGTDDKLGYGLSHSGLPLETRKISLQGLHLIESKEIVFDNIFSISKMTEEQNDYLLPYIHLSQKSIDSHLLHMGEESLNIQMELIGEMEALYRTTIYVNHFPLLLDGMITCYEMPTIPGFVTTKNLSIPKASIKSGDVIYAVCVPFGEIAFENKLVPYKSTSRTVY